VRQVGATVLSRVLARLELPPTRPEVLVGLDHPDDCAIVAFPSGEGGRLASVHTVDFFRSFISDPCVAALAVLAQVCPSLRGERAHATYPHPCPPPPPLLHTRLRVLLTVHRGRCCCCRYVFGQIAANHALSDCHAMCADAVSALAIVVVPFAVEEKMEQVLTQACAALRARGAVLVCGGLRRRCPVFLSLPFVSEDGVVPSPPTPVHPLLYVTG
jgi:hypothetical protein